MKVVLFDATRHFIDGDSSIMMSSISIPEICSSYSHMTVQKFHFADLHTIYEKNCSGIACTL